MDTSNASEPPPGDELSGECAVVLKADVQKSMEENVSTSIAGSSGSENRKVRGFGKYTPRWEAVYSDMGYNK